jgi:hypothetical protein
MTPEVIGAAVRLVLPWVADDAIHVVSTAGGRPRLLVYGSPDWLDRMPAARLGQLRGGIELLGYDLGFGLLVVQIDHRPRGDA